MKTKNEVVKTVKLGVKLSAREKVEKTAKLVWQKGVLIYRIFKTIHAQAYSAQGELTCANLRKGEYVILEKEKSHIGKDFVIFNGAKGIGAMSGTIAEILGRRAICSGRFALALDSIEVIYSGTYAGMVAFVKKHGEGNGTYSGGRLFTYAIGVGLGYGMGITEGKIGRLENNTSSRGRAWHYTVEKSFASVAARMKLAE